MENENEIKAIANAFIRVAADLSDLADRLHRLADGKMEKMDSEQICQRKHGTQGYQAVNLGLPSGLKWADRNVGAESPEAYGDYFMWGSVTPDTDNVCDWAHAPFNGCASEFGKEYFNTNKSRWVDGDVLKPEYDAATQIMGGSWRMPTADEMHELLDGTTNNVEKLNGVKGMRFTSKVNGSSIFMPFAGQRDVSEAHYVSSRCFAWSSTLNIVYTGSSNYIYLDGFGCALVSSNDCYLGFVVRGVHE